MRAPAQRDLSNTLRSDALFAVLAEVSMAVRASPARTVGPGFDPDRAILDLTVATQDLASLLRIVENLPHRLLQSELLFVRARSIAPRADILAERSKGGLVVARQLDAPNLVSTTAEASRQAAGVVELLFASMDDHFAGPPIVRTAADNVPSL